MLKPKARSAELATRFLVKKMAIIKKLDLTQGQLRSLLHYDQEIGRFTWLRREADNIGNRIFNGRFAGKAADSPQQDGYFRLRFTANGRFHEYMSHRLAWLYVYGSEPPEGMEIDHINRVRDDNRIANLRLATTAENKRNSSIRKTSKSGKKGVVNVGKINQSKPWCAFITTNKKTKNLGYFSTPEEAQAAYIVATLEQHGNFSPYAPMKETSNV